MLVHSVSVSDFVCLAAIRGLNQSLCTETHTHTSCPCGTGIEPKAFRPIYAPRPHLFHDILMLCFWRQDLTKVPASGWTRIWDCPTSTSYSAEIQAHFIHFLPHTYSWLFCKELCFSELCCLDIVGLPSSCSWFFFPPLRFVILAQLWFKIIKEICRNKPFLCCKLHTALGYVWWNLVAFHAKEWIHCVLWIHYPPINQWLSEVSHLLS